jgi:hypothetical protein
MARIDFAMGLVLQRLGGAYVAHRRHRRIRCLAASAGGENAARGAGAAFVVIDFDPWQTIIDLSITNVGKTLARDVHFEFQPPLTSTHYGTPPRERLSDLNLFKNGIPSLAPGREIRVFFDQFPARVGAGLPLTYDVRVSCSDPVRRTYEDRTVLDLASYLGTGGVTRHDIHDLHRQVEKIAQTLHKWTDPDGIKVLSWDQRQRRNEERNAKLAQEEAAAAANETAPQNDSTA